MPILDHKHLIVNATVSKPPIDPDAAIDFLKKLVDKIGMKIKVGPFAGYCEAEGNNGITAAVCIETSHISLHAWDQVDQPYLRLDVYSCATFDPGEVIKMINEEYEAIRLEFLVIGRNEIEGNQQRLRSTFQIGDVCNMRFKDDGKYFHA